MANNEWNLKEAIEAEKEGRWSRAAYLYLTQSKPDEALKAILKTKEIQDSDRQGLCVQLTLKGSSRYCNESQLLEPRFNT